MTSEEIVSQLEPLGTEGYRRILRNHGVSEPLFGVKVEELKKVQKTVKKDYRLAMELYDTGIYDAMYLASLIADESKMTQEDFQGWLEKADSLPVAEYAVAWVASDSPHAWDLAQKWIESPDEKTAVAGWACLSSLISVKDNSELDILALRKYLQRVRETIHQQQSAIRHRMNSYVISLGSYVPELTDEALKVGEEIGPVHVDMGNTSCKVPFAPDYIRKVEAKGRLGKKRKTARC